MRTVARAYLSDCVAIFCVRIHQNSASVSRCDHKLSLLFSIFVLASPSSLNELFKKKKLNSMRDMQVFYSL